uniref:Uncharacterized protein n=1 Tax=Lactuca sativa TaxID=4236 RepID=A0A9R1XA52_LACSA|nr:hypothetical protein LSAT_V11C500291290 [Lactuca sativa]
MVGFLEKFKVKTDTVSTSTKPMAHRFFGEICDDFLYFAVILDPWFKFDFLQQAFEKLIKLKNPKKDPMLNSKIILKAKTLIRGLQQRFENFFYFYKSKFDNTDSSQN